MPAALVNETDIFGLPRLERPCDSVFQHLREAEDRVQGRAQLMAHICEELRFGEVGRFGYCLGLAQRTLGQHFLGNVARRAAVAKKPSRLIKKWIAADRDNAFGILTDFSCVSKIAEGLVQVQHREMLLPFGRLVGHVSGQVAAPPADAGLRVLTERTNMVREVCEAMLFVGLPEPVR
jgi:hypothetical protein